MSKEHSRRRDETLSGLILGARWILRFSGAISTTEVIWYRCEMIVYYGLERMWEDPAVFPVTVYENL